MPAENAKPLKNFSNFLFNLILKDTNTAVYFALINLGDTVMGMNLSHGGHLTHGSPVNMSGKYFNFVAYGAMHKLRISL